MKRYLPYNKDLKEYSRELRNNSTLGEVLLWKCLRARNMMGYQFYRQKPLGNYIVDFYCPALKLIIEIDGQSHDHDEVFNNDQIRQEELMKFNLNFLRFTEAQVRNDIVSVLYILENYILEHEEKHPEILKRKQRSKQS